MLKTLLMLTNFSTETEPFLKGIKRTLLPDPDDIINRNLQMDSKRLYRYSC